MTEFTILLSPSFEDRTIIATCAELPGCVSQARTKVEALVKIKEAIEVCLEAGDVPGPVEIVQLTLHQIDTLKAVTDDSDRFRQMSERELNEALEAGELSGIAPAGVIQRVLQRALDL